jgi:hypothetical protein
MPGDLDCGLWARVPPRAGTRLTGVGTSLLKFKRFTTPSLNGLAMQQIERPTVDSVGGHSATSFEVYLHSLSVIHLLIIVM